VDRLWSPWRMAYLEAVHADDDVCFLCRAAEAGRADEERLYLLATGERAFVLLNAFPYNPGHLMIAVRRHVGEVEILDPGELAEVSALLQRSIRALKDVSDPDGFNVGLNLGRVAGAGVPGHLHWHVIPRWNGDTNFVTVVGETRVLPELLADTYAKLRPAF
jgi:ATP adenylyltransferase